MSATQDQAGDRTVVAGMTENGEPGLDARLQQVDVERLSALAGGRHMDENHPPFYNCFYNHFVNRVTP